MRPDWLTQCVDTIYDMATSQTNPTIWWLRPFDADQPLGEQIRNAGVRFADRRAVQLANGSFVVHGYLHEQAEPLRQAIADSLATRGGAVACLTRTSETLMIAMIATLTTASSVTFLDDSMPPSWNREALNTLGARTIVADRSTYQSAQTIADCDDTIILVESPAVTNAQTEIRVPRDGTLTIFTSGSTGRAKGVLRPFTAMAHTAYNLSWRYQCQPDDIMLYVGSPAHVGTLNDALLCVLNGFCSIPVQLTDIDIRSITHLIQQQDVNKIAMPPSLMRLFLRYVAMGNPIEQPLMICSSGEALLRSDVRLFYNVLDTDSTLWQSYGSTEAGHMVAGYYRPEHGEGSGPLPLNHVARGVEIEILDQEGNAVSTGETGHVRVRTPALAHGYCAEDMEQHSDFGEDDVSRYFMTGDRAQLVEPGVLLLEGRSDRQINRYGRRIELGEIESVILETPGWGEACAALISEGEHRQTLMAMASQLEGGESDPEALRSKLRETLPAFAVPAQILCVPRLPRTSSGKVDLSAVKMALASHLTSTRTSGDQAAVGPTENWIADAWQAVLETDVRPSRDVNFDAFGGDSLNAIDLCLRLGEKFDVQLGIDFIAEHRTLVAQAAAIQDIASGLLQSSRIVPLRNDGVGPIVVMIPGAGGHAWVFLRVADQMQCPCDLLALNLQTHKPDDLSIEHLTSVVIDSIGSANTKRPVYIAGYSYGSLVACSLARSCREMGVPIAGVAMIDPRPLRSRSSLTRPIRLAKSAFQSLSPTKRAVQPTQFLDRQIQETRAAIAKIYRPQDIELGDLPCSVLCTAETMAMLHNTQSLFKRPLHELDIQDVSGLNHLELMQRIGTPVVAAWLCGVLSQNERDSSSYAKTA